MSNFGLLIRQALRYSCRSEEHTWPTLSLRWLLVVAFLSATKAESILDEGLLKAHKYQSTQVLKA